MRKLTLTLAVVTAVWATPARTAGLDSEMTSMFNTMLSTTNPGVYSGMRRHVLSGGQFRANSRIVNQDIANLRLPSFKAGCGGIDLFAGSFSFISAEQFTQLLRGVAANATGYAFKLALSSMCERCGTIIESLQKKIQQLNQLFSNSCQLSQGLVNDSWEAVSGKQARGASAASLSDGFGDVFESFSSTNGKEPQRNARDMDTSDWKDKYTGNLVWKALKQNNAASWFANGNDELLEVMMNFSGTVIIQDLESDAEGGESTPFITMIGNLDIRTLIDGGEVTIQGCDSGSGTDENGCLSLKTKTLTFDGFEKRLKEGLSSDSGIINKLFNSQKLTSEEEALLSNSYSVGATIFDLARRNPRAAEQMVQSFADLMAYELASRFLQDMMQTVQTAAATSQVPGAVKLQDTLANASERLLSRESLVRAGVAKRADVIKFYQQMLSLRAIQTYPLATAVRGS